MVPPEHCYKAILPVIYYKILPLGHAGILVRFEKLDLPTQYPHRFSLVRENATGS